MKKVAEKTWEFTEAAVPSGFSFGVQFALRGRARSAGENLLRNLAFFLKPICYFAPLGQDALVVMTANQQLILESLVAGWD